MKRNIAPIRLCLFLAAFAFAGHAMGGSDNFANATNIAATRYTSDEVSLFGFTKESGETLIDSSNAGKTAWWKWTAPEDGLCTVDTHFRAETAPINDTEMGVFTGSAVNALTLVASNDDSFPTGTGIPESSSKCTFYAVKDTTYHIVVDGYDASEVTITNNRVVLSLGFVPRRAMRKLAAGYETDATPAYSYSVSFNKTSNFGFSGRIRVGSVSYPIKGQLSPEGTFTAALPRSSPSASAPLMPLGLLLDAKDGGTVTLWSGSESGTSATLLEFRSFPGTATTPLAGQFTNNGNVIERVAISSKGSVMAAGRALDGTSYTYAGPLCASFTQMAGVDSILPISVNLHGGKGFLSHRLSFEEAGAIDVLEAISYYVRPANPASTFYPGGIKTSASISFGVKTYTRPTTGNRALGFLNMTSGNGKLSINAVMGELAAKVEELLNFSTANRFTFVSVIKKPVLSIDTRTGWVSGSVIDGAGKKRTLFGALTLDHNSVPRLSGWASGTTQNIGFQVN